MMKMYYRTFVMGGWSKSACCDLVPLRHSENAFYCQCSNAQLIAESNSFNDGYPSSVCIPEVKLILNPPVKKTKVPEPESTGLPW